MTLLENIKLPTSTNLFTDINIIITMLSFLVFILWSFGSTKSVYYHIAESGVIPAISLILTKMTVVSFFFIKNEEFTNLQGVSRLVFILSFIVDIHLFSFFWQIMEKSKRLFSIKYDSRIVLNLAIFTCMLVLSGIYDDYFLFLMNYGGISMIYMLLSNVFLYFLNGLYKTRMEAS